MKTRSRGTTLMELMTALAVLGVLIAIAVPTFREFTAISRSAAFTNDLVTALNYARSESLHRSSSVAVCASANQTVCSGSSNWATGWIAFDDRNGNRLLEATEPVLRVWTPASNGIAVTATASPSGIAVNRVVYDAMGMGALGSGTTRVRFRFIPTGCTGTRAGLTDVSITGAIRSRKVACP